MILPDRISQLDPPGRATQVERTLQFDEGRGIAAENPDVGVLRLLPDQWCQQSGDPSDLDLYDITCSFVVGAADRERILSFGRDQEFHEHKKAVDQALSV
jgi:hypothetical protein